MNHMKGIYKGNKICRYRYGAHHRYETLDELKKSTNSGNSTIGRLRAISILLNSKLDIKKSTLN